MAFTSITPDVEVQPGTFAYSFTASGTILAGQAVQFAADETVKTSESGKTAEFAGVAAYDAADGDKIAVYCGGNIVKARISGTWSAGTPVIPEADGYFKSGSKTERVGTIVKAASTKGGIGYVLLL